MFSIPMRADPGARFFSVVVRCVGPALALVLLLALPGNALAQSKGADAGVAPTATAEAPLDTPAPAPPVQLGGSGESCTKSADCASGLKCVGQVCVDPAKGQDGDSCASAGDCNAHLRCVEKRCAKPGAASSGSHGVPGPGAPGASAASAKPENCPWGRNESAGRCNTAIEWQQAQQEAHEQRAFGGVSGTLSIGYGGSTGEDLGFARGLNGSFRFARKFGMPLLLTIAPYEDFFNKDEVVGGYMSGLHLLHPFFIDVLFGYVRGRAKGSEQVDVALGAGIGLGYEIGITRYFAITPQADVIHQFGGKDPIVLFLVGPTVRVPHADDPVERKPTK